MKHCRIKYLVFSCEIIWIVLLTIFLKRSWIYKNLKRDFLQIISLCDTKTTKFGIFFFVFKKTILKRNIVVWFRKRKGLKRRWEFEFKLKEFWQILRPFSTRISVFSSVI